MNEKTMSFLSLLPLDVKNILLYYIDDGDIVEVSKTVELQSLCNDKFWQLYAKKRNIYLLKEGDVKGSVRCWQTFAALALLATKYSGLYGLYSPFDRHQPVDKLPIVYNNPQYFIDKFGITHFVYFEYGGSVVVDLRRTEISIKVMHATAELTVPYQKVSIICIHDPDEPEEEDLLPHQEPDIEWYNVSKLGRISYPSVGYDERYFLPCLNTRKYIHVDVPFQKVCIYSNEKGSAITIDDILFASRGLMWHNTDTIYYGFVFRAENETSLLLEACMLDPYD